MTISFDIPNAKAVTLLGLYAKRYNLTVPDTNAEKAALLSKVVKHEIVQLYRGYIQEQAIQSANVTLKADPDVAETELEAMLKDSQPQ